MNAEHIYRSLCGKYKLFAASEIPPLPDRDVSGMPKIRKYIFMPVFSGRGSCFADDESPVSGCLSQAVRAGVGRYNECRAVRFPCKQK